MRYMKHTALDISRKWESFQTICIINLSNKIHVNRFTLNTIIIAVVIIFYQNMEIKHLTWGLSVVIGVPIDQHIGKWEITCIACAYNQSVYKLILELNFSVRCKTIKANMHVKSSQTSQTSHFRLPQNLI